MPIDDPVQRLFEREQRPPSKRRARLRTVETQQTRFVRLLGGVVADRIRRSAPCLAHPLDDPGDGPCVIFRRTEVPTIGEAALAAQQPLCDHQIAAQRF
jgi:hypothetical protein